jgi:hypothetical protein
VRLDVLGLAKVLHGARETIGTYRPVLAIVLSSRLSDIIAIQPMLQEIADFYDFFLDHVDAGSAGAVLFARPHVPRPRGRADDDPSTIAAQTASTE